MPAYDLIIRNGTIVDGTGQDRFTGDLAVKDGLIAQVGHVSGDAAEEIDADAAYVLLTDADITHDSESLRRLVAKAEVDGLNLVSLMVRLRCESLWEKLLIPAFILFFEKL